MTQVNRIFLLKKRYRIHTRPPGGVEVSVFLMVHGLHTGWLWLPVSLSCVLNIEFQETIVVHVALAKSWQMQCECRITFLLHNLPSDHVWWWCIILYTLGWTAQNYARWTILYHRRPTRVVRLVRNLSRVADHGLAPYHSVNNGRIHKSPQIDLLHPLNLVVCVDNEVFYLFGRFWSRSWPFREVSFTAVCSPTYVSEQTATNETSRNGKNDSRSDQIGKIRYCQHIQ